MDSSGDFIAQIIKDDAWKIGPAMVLLHWLVVRRMQHPTQSEHRRQQVSQVSHQVFVRAGEQMHVCMHGEYLAITHVHLHACTII